MHLLFNLILTSAMVGNIFEYIILKALGTPATVVETVGKNSIIIRKGDIRAHICGILWYMHVVGTLHVNAQAKLFSNYSKIASLLHSYSVDYCIEGCNDYTLCM